MVLNVSMLRLGQQSRVFGRQRRRECVSRCNVKASISKGLIVRHIAEVQRPQQWNTAIAGRGHKANRCVEQDPKRVPIAVLDTDEVVVPSRSWPRDVAQDAATTPVLTQGSMHTSEPTPPQVPIAGAPHRRRVNAADLHSGSVSSIARTCRDPPLRTVADHRQFEPKPRRSGSPGHRWDLEACSAWGNGVTAPVTRWLVWSQSWSEF